jgi:hypothetical protein
VRSEPSGSVTALGERAQFITEFARRLHLAGVSAARLEGAVKSTAESIGVACEILRTTARLGTRDSSDAPRASGAELVGSRQAR